MKYSISGILIICFVLAFVLSPYTLVFATSGSMEPTITEGSVYIVDKSADVAVDDIVVFHSDKRTQLVTHRIIESTPTGYVTQGDANPYADQTLGGKVLTADNIYGAVITTPSGPLTLQISPTGEVFEYKLELVALLTIGIGAVLLHKTFTPPRRSASTTSRTSEIAFTIKLTIIIVLTLSLLVAYSPAEYTHTVEVVDKDTISSTTITVGEIGSYENTYRSQASPITYTLIDVKNAEKQTVETKIGGNRHRVTVDVGPYDSPGTYDYTVTAYQYPRILPNDLITFLHARSPLVAALTTVGSIFAPLAALFSLLLYQPAGRR
jgi:signal peptidase